MVLAGAVVLIEAASVVVVACVTATVVASDIKVVVFVVSSESGEVELALEVVFITVVALLVGVVDAISIVEYSIMKPPPFTLASEKNLESAVDTMNMSKST